MTASGKFVTGKDAKGKEEVYSASCAAVLVPAVATGATFPASAALYMVYLYFPPKVGKFEDGFAAGIPLMWDGTAFALRD